MKRKPPPPRPDACERRAVLSELRPSGGFRVEFTTEEAMNLALKAPELLKACRLTEKILEKGWVKADDKDLDELGEAIDDVLSFIDKRPKSL